MGYDESFDITTAPQGAGPAYGNVNNFEKTSNANKFRAVGGMPIVLPDGSTYLAPIAYPATGGTGKSTAGGPAPDQTARVFISEVINPTNVDTKLYTVTSGKSFYLTDFVITGSASATAKLKARVATTQGATTIGAGTAFTFPATSLSSVNGDAIYVGQTVYLEDPGAANYEAVVVTGVTRNAGGIITGITATTTKTHAAGITIAYPVALAQITSSKGIEVIGQETQPTVAGGWDLVITYGAVTGSLMQNIAGFEQ